MTRQDYLEFILDHYHNPRNRGAIPDPDMMVNGGNPGCGDVITIYVTLDDADRVTNVKFEGKGCTISMAGASLATEMIKGKTLQEIEALSYDGIIEQLGEDVVKSRLRCATLGIDTLKAGAREYPTRKALGRKLIAPIVLAHTLDID